ncbi:hypothetical protein [Paenibacillus sp. FSL R7-0652]|uniref:hypothetical protein n=1 Tax=Paenibacillus sp. FSL R7-0652 TaxID=2921687 RepID=UPI00315A4F6E
MKKTQHFKRLWLFVGMAAAAAVLYFWLMNNRFVDIHTPLSSAEVVRADTSKAVYTKIGGGAHIRFDDAVLNEEDISRVVHWLNEAPGLAKTPVDRIDGSIHMGIALRLKHHTGVTIQYNGSQIYVTKNGRFNQTSRYALHHPELKNYLDEELEGTYFGGSPVKGEQEGTS